MLTVDVLLEARRTTTIMLGLATASSLLVAMVFASALDNRGLEASLRPEDICLSTVDFRCESPVETLSSMTTMTEIQGTSSVRRSLPTSGNGHHRRAHSIVPTSFDAGGVLVRLTAM